MNFALILAGGVGQRMRTSGLPKQFLKVFGKPIIIYTLEKFQECNFIDNIMIACNINWIDYMKDLVREYKLTKVREIIPGGGNRQESIICGLKKILTLGVKENDIVVIHDGVRPLIESSIIERNVISAKKYGSAMTVKPVIESVIIAESDEAQFKDFKRRDFTYSLTSPQSFTIKALTEAYSKTKNANSPIPLLDAALSYTFLGNKVHLVKENNHNIKITTPEDYYILKAILELRENQQIFGL